MQEDSNFFEVLFLLPLFDKGKGIRPTFKHNVLTYGYIYLDGLKHLYIIIKQT